jgi:hypothetical protein
MSWLLDPFLAARARAKVGWGFQKGLGDAHVYSLQLVNKAAVPYLTAHD